MNKKYLVATAFFLIFSAYHFCFNVLTSKPDVNPRSSFSHISNIVQGVDVGLNAEQLANIYGIDYTPPMENEVVQEEATVIYLDQTLVVVKAVSRLGSDYFVVVDYQQQGEMVRKKLMVGDQLLSYRLVGIDKSALHFEDQTKKTLTFSIFKKSEQ